MDELMLPPRVLLMLIKPVMALAGTGIVNSVEEKTFTEVGGLAPKRTETGLLPFNCRPLIVTGEPTAAPAGLKPVICGPGPMTVKAVALLLEPMVVVTVIGPFVARKGTSAVICVPLF